MPFLRLVVSGQRAPQPVEGRWFLQRAPGPGAEFVRSYSAGTGGGVPGQPGGGSEQQIARGRPLADRPVFVDPYLPPPLIVPPGGGLPHY